MDFENTIILENERVRLQPLQLSDTEHLLKFSLQEPDLWRYSLLQAVSESGLKNYLTHAIDGRVAKKVYPFIVFDKSFNTYAGSTRYYDIDLAAKCLSLGYTWYGQQFQGTGLNKHCKYLLLEYAFEQLGMERVEFRADANNVKSIAAMKSIGCTVEGILRSNGLGADGNRRDSIVLSILKSEWYDSIKSNLKAKLVF